MPYNAGVVNVRETPLIGAGTTAQRIVSINGGLWVNLDNPDAPVLQRYRSSDNTWIDIEASAPTLPAWSLNGNTLAGGEKLGSVNNQPVVMYHNNIEVVRLTALLMAVTGSLNFGVNLVNNDVRGNLNFRNNTNVCYIMQDSSTIRSIQVPGTGGNAPWIFNNIANQGIRVQDNSSNNNAVTLQPGNNRGITLGVNGFGFPTYALRINCVAANNINLQLGDASVAYANNVGYNVQVLAGPGGGTGANKGGNVVLIPGAGGGGALQGNVIVNNLQSFASNAAAVAAGLPVGSLYLRSGHGLDAVV